MHCVLWQDVTEFLEDLREYDVPYHVRFAIDTGTRSGFWYEVSCKVCDLGCRCRRTGGAAVLT